MSRQVMLVRHDRGDRAMNQNLDTQSKHFSKAASLVVLLKKSGKFLKALSKQNIIQIKDYGAAGGEIMIVSVNFEYLMNHFNASKSLDFFSPEAFAKFAAKCKELQEREERLANGAGDETKENEADQAHFEASSTGKKRQVDTLFLYALCSLNICWP